MAVSQTQTIRVAAQSLAQAGERRNLMGANRTQGLGITVFLAGFTALSGAIYSGKVLLYLVAVVLLALSVVTFRKCKPLENSEK
ncbi:MAG: hypothetical protein WBL63_21115 [Candidatus Acidiferrum sp.]